MVVCVCVCVCVWVQLQKFILQHILIMIHMLWCVYRGRQGPITVVQLQVGLNWSMKEAVDPVSHTGKWDLLR